MMTNEEKLEIVKRKIYGQPVKKIANDLGFNETAIYAFLERFSKQRVENDAWKLCVYDGLSKYMHEHNLSAYALAKWFGNKEASTFSTIRKRLSGESDFTLSQIRKILEVTGMTFEECFALREGMADAEDDSANGNSELD